MSLLKIFMLSVVFLLAGANNGYANSEVKKRFSILGIISHNKGEVRKSGIVMLLDKRSRKNLVLRTGDALPGTGFSILKVSKNSVTIGRGKKRFTLIRDKFANPSPTSNYVRKKARPRRNDDYRAAPPIHEPRKKGQTNRYESTGPGDALPPFDQPPRRKPSSRNVENQEFRSQPYDPNRQQFGEYERFGGPEDVPFNDGEVFMGDSDDDIYYENQAFDERMKRGNFQSDGSNGGFR